MATAFKWQTAPEQAYPEYVDNYLRSVEAGIFGIFQSYAPAIENWMKETAIWMDRTGNARQTLWAEAMNPRPHIFTLEFDHGMSYGANLEFNYGGVYAIVGPALDVFTPQVAEDLRNLVR